jgi:Transposase
VEIADPAGKPTATMQVSNDSAGFARVLDTIAEVAPGPRVAVCIEGTRSYGIGLARALAAAGLLVIECEQPRRKQRRGKGKSDPIDAHLAVLAALRLDAARVPVPRADGDREALRILLVARQEIRAARNAQGGRLRALLLAGGDADRRAARGDPPQVGAAQVAVHQRVAGAGHCGHRGELGPGSQPPVAGHHRKQHPPHPPGERQPAVACGPGKQRRDRRVTAKHGQPVQQLRQLAGHRVLPGPAGEGSERPAGQPGQRDVAPAERGAKVAGGHRSRDRQASPAQCFQQRHRGGQTAPRFLVAGEPVGHLAGQHHIVELASHQPRAVIPASSQAHDPQVPGKPPVHPRDTRPSPRQ